MRYRWQRPLRILALCLCLTFLLLASERETEQPLAVELGLQTVPTKNDLWAAQALAASTANFGFMSLLNFSPAGFRARDRATSSSRVRIADRSKQKRSMGSAAWFTDGEIAYSYPDRRSSGDCPRSDHVFSRAPKMESSRSLPNFD